MDKYPQFVKSSHEHQFITEELLDEFTQYLYSHPKFHAMAEKYARKQVAAVLREYGHTGGPGEIEATLGRPISQTDLGCDKYYEWFRGLMVTWMASLPPYPVWFDRQLIVVDFDSEEMEEHDITQMTQQ